MTSTIRSPEWNENPREFRTTEVIMVDWPVDEAIAGITNAGAFGPECEFVSFKLDRRHTGKDQFASVVLYGTVTVGDRGGVHRRHRLVVKIKHQRPEMRIILRNDIQFHNEKQFYERVSPFLMNFLPADGGRTGDRAPPFCRYFYGRNECGDLGSRDMIVLENARADGYRSSEERLHLDLDHLVVALKTLAKFHALSYRAKSKDSVKFIEMLSRVRETQWINGEWVILEALYKSLLSMVFNRLVERCGGHDVERLQRFRAEFLDDALQSLRNVMEPTEPLSILCHGDFNRNNMLFQYDENGRPAEAMLFDMATVRYGSPALDLSFFLYLNTDRQTRDAHWDELLDTYCTSLAAAVSDVADIVQVPDRKQLDAEMHYRSFYGLAHVSYFVRLMMEQEMSTDTIQFGMAEDEICKLMMKFGGDNATNVIADAFQHFIDIRYADSA